MIPYATDTLRQAARDWGTWVLGLIGLAGGWAGLHLGILSFTETEASVRELVGSTGLAVGALLGLWVLARAIEEDRVSGFREPADCTGPGATGRLLGRWAGATLVGALAAVLTGHALAATAGSTPATPSLYFASIIGVAHATSVGVFVAATWAGGPVLSVGLVAWILGHLPWGSPNLVPGPVGQMVGALLPHGAGAAVSGILATGAWLCLGLAAAPREVSPSRS